MGKQEFNGSDLLLRFPQPPGAVGYHKTYDLSRHMSCSLVNGSLTAWNYKRAAFDNNSQLLYVKRKIQRLFFFRKKAQRKKNTYSFHNAFKKTACMGSMRRTFVRALPPPSQELHPDTRGIATGLGNTPIQQLPNCRRLTGYAQIATFLPIH